jgi:hypothetical protein
MKRSIAIILSVLTLAGVNALTSCGGGGSPAAPPPPSTTHFSVTGSSANATAGVAFNFTVQALDASNNGVASYSGTMHFTSSDSQAILPANSTLANGAGSFSVTFRTPGQQTITATDTVTPSITGTSNSITVTGPATHLSLTAPAAAVTGVAIQVMVTAQDVANNTVTNYSGTVHFTSTDAKAVLPANSTLTNGTGTFSMTFETSGAQTITATDTVTASITGTSNSITVTGPATHLSLTAPAAAVTGVAIQVMVTAQDVANNTVTNYSGTVHFTSSDAKAVLPANSTLTNGTRTFSVTFETSGVQTITATDTVTASVTGTSNSITVSGAATHFSVTAPASVTAGTAFNITVTALDALNNVATSYAGTVHFTSSDPQADLPPNSTLLNGSNTFPAALKTAGSQTITATDTATASITGTSSSINVTASQAENPVPFINQPLIPTAGAPGGGWFTLTVTGTGFVAGSVVDWNGSPRATTVMSESRATATILAADIAAPNTASVTVVNPAPGGGTSNAVYFEATVPTTWAGLVPRAELSAESAPSSVVTADFNGDGKLDLAVTNVDSNDVSVFLGNGDGTFQPAVQYPVGQQPTSIAVGDFNGDGKLDLVVVDSADATVTILLGEGDGTFQTLPEVPAFGASPAGLAVGDFNGDGKLDLAVTNENSGANLGSGTVSILLGNGDGTFQLALNFSAGSNPGPIAVGDLNGDGKLDLVVANNDAGTTAVNNTINVLLGNGDGSFQPAQSFTVGTNPTAVALADFNGDGKLDAAVSNHDANNLSILLGKGDGTFQPAMNFAAGSGPQSLVVADLNGDGKLDLAVADGGDNTVSLLLGNGDGSFQAAVPYGSNDPFLSAAAGDFNRDGRLDLAAVELDGGIAVLLQPEIAAGSNATLSPSGLDFSCNSRCFCSDRSTTATLSDFGTEALDIGGITISGPFSESNTCSPILQPGQSCSFSFDWSKRTGDGTLSIQDNAPGSPQTTSLDGSNRCSGCR